MAYFCHPFQLFRVFNTKEHKKWQQNEISTTLLPIASWAS